MQVFNNFFEILLAPMEPKNLILLNFPKKAYHAPPPPAPAFGRIFTHDT